MGTQSIWWQVIGFHNSAYFPSDKTKIPDSSKLINMNIGGDLRSQDPQNNAENKQTI